MKDGCSESINHDESREVAIFGGRNCLFHVTAAGCKAPAIRRGFADAAEKTLGRVGQAIPLPWLSQAGRQASEVPGLFMPGRTASGDRVEFLGMEIEVAGSGDWVEEYGAGAPLGASSQQQPVCNFPRGENSPFGESLVEPADSTRQRGLADQVRGGVGVVGDLCGFIAISWDELPGGELDLGGTYAWICQDAKGV